MKFNTIGGLAISTLLIAVPLSIASAADMPVKAPPLPPAPVNSWSGCYIGANGGYQWGDGNANLALQPSVAAWTAIDPAFGAYNGRYAHSPSSDLVGGQVGCNLQSGSFVVGIETDIDYLGASNTTNRTGMAATVPNLASVTQKLDSLGTVRGRLGVTPSANWLIYATGGLAYGRTSFSNQFVRTDLSPNVGFAGNASQTPTGWTIGAGAEFMITGNWTVKAEYLYYDLGSVRVIGAPFNQPANSFGADGIFQTKGSIARIGLNYKFGGPFFPKN
jgi:outer membrane immunogenic protein